VPTTRFVRDFKSWVFATQEVPVLTTRSWQTLNTHLTLLVLLYSKWV